MSDVKETGERIRRLRKEKGWTQTDLGNRIGVQNSAIAKYENGRVPNLKRSTIKALADALGVNPSYLLGLDESADYITAYTNVVEVMHTMPADNVDDADFNNLVMIYDKLNHRLRDKLLAYAEGLAESMDD